MLKKVLIGLAVVVVAFLGFVLMQPSTFKVERTATIHAPRAVVFDLVNTMQKRAAWYPWDRLDPTMQRTYDGPASGKGAHYAWKGNDKVGTGEQTILESVENEKIVDSLHFIEPFEDTNTAYFTFADDGANTKVTWGLEGGGGFSTKLMNAFMDMDAALGKDFEDGLKNLDEVAKKAVEEQKAAVVDEPKAEEGGDAKAEVVAEEKPTAE